MKKLAFILATLLVSCGAVSTNVVQPACAHADCEATWSHSCHYIRAGRTLYDTWEVPGWEHAWDCAWYNESWKYVRLTWGMDGVCFTVPEVETGVCR